jgi:hypothetical protein
MACTELIAAQYHDQEQNFSMHCKVKHTENL